MYSVTPAAAGLWRLLLETLARKAGVAMAVIDHAAPQPIAELWSRKDKGAVFMCGLPFSQKQPQPLLIAAPVPSHGEASYWTDLIVAADGPFRQIEDTFGGRIALTLPESQSGFAAPLSHFMSFRGQTPLYAEVIAPVITPMGAVRAVIDGKAEIAALDSYAHALLRRHAPALAAQIRTVAVTKPTPIPPLVASTDAAEPLAIGFANAHRDAETAPLLSELLLQRFVRPEPAVYDELRRDLAIALRFWGERPFASSVHPAFAQLEAEPVGSKEEV